MIDHPLAQIGEDGSTKLPQRIFPLLVINAGAGRPAATLASVVRAWLDLASEGAVKDPQAARLVKWRDAGRGVAAALADPKLFPPPFRTNPSVRAALLGEAG
jgi:mannitol-1-phosphate/altronate dehydrogenase